MNKQQADLILHSAPVGWEYYDPQESIFYLNCTEWYYFDQHWKLCEMGEETLERMVAGHEVLAIVLGGDLPSSDRVLIREGEVTMWVTEDFYEAMKEHPSLKELLDNKDNS